MSVVTLERPLSKARAISKAKPTVNAKPTIFYPESDGKPMGETEYHVVALLHLFGVLRNFLRLFTDVYVIADMFLYYQEGNPRACVSPDIMVVKGVVSRKRRTFKMWEEGAAPCTIIEVTSASTRSEDTVNKSSLYASLGVREYFLFDPLHEYLDEQLWGFRLSDEGYIRLTPNAEGGIFSQELGVVLQPDGDLLRAVDPATDDFIPTLDEALDRVEEVLEQIEQETSRADRESLRAEREAIRAEQEAVRAEQEAMRAEQEAMRAEQEAMRADAAEAAVAQLLVEIARLRQQ